MENLNYLWEGIRKCALSHLPDSCRESSISCGFILFHSLVSFSLITCNSFIKSGSFLFCILHLLRGAEIYLRKAKLFVNLAYLYARFMFYNVFKIPTKKYRNVMHRATGNMKRIRRIFNRDNFIFYITTG